MATVTLCDICNCKTNIIYKCETRKLENNTQFDQTKYMDICQSCTDRINRYIMRMKRMKGIEDYYGFIID